LYASELANAPFLETVLVQSVEHDVVTPKIEQLIARINGS